jgi:hypothetical protein
MYAGVRRRWHENWPAVEHDHHFFLSIDGYSLTVSAIDQLDRLVLLDDIIALVQLQIRTPDEK